MTKNQFKPVWLICAVIVVGIAARLLVAMRSHNFDMDSWWVVADILNHGCNVYAGTDRYNYGPVWFNILHGLDILAGHNHTALRYIIPGFLSLVDIGIFYILWRILGKLAAIFFFLNPITIIITGYHTQFDNLAILLGLLSVLLIGDDFDKPLDRRRLFGLLVLGLSLATKHLFFAFPFWLAVKQKGMNQKLMVLFLPIAVFAAGFLPYWAAGSNGIIHNVFMYHSINNQYFYFYLVPKAVQILFKAQTIWFLVLVISAFVYRQKNALESMLFYTAVLVAASPSIVNQYFAIPMPFVASHLNPLTILYTAVATMHLLVSNDGLFVTGLIVQKCNNVAVCVLVLALIWTTWPQQIKALIDRSLFEVKNQLGLK